MGCLEQGWKIGFISAPHFNELLGSLEVLPVDSVGRVCHNSLSTFNMAFEGRFVIEYNFPPNLQNVSSLHSVVLR